MVVNERHIEKALSPIVVTVLGIVMEVTEQLSKELLLMIVKLAMMAFADSLVSEHPLNALLPTVEIVPATVTVANFLQSWNAPSPTDVTELGKEMVVKA